MRMGNLGRTVLRLSRIPLEFLPIFLMACLPAAAQLSPTEPDPLARIRDTARTNVEACSATGETLCEQVAPKIIANAQGDSPLAENLRRLAGAQGHTSGPSAEPAPIAWAVAAFRDAGVEAHTEGFDGPGGSEGASHQKENVVAEIRGREKPDEWVLLGARLDSSGAGAGDEACNAALVIEAARDIQLTGIHPRRSIRFVLFDGQNRGMNGSWAYVRAHRGELDRARAVVLFDAAANPVTGFALNGRRDIESGVREAMKPIDSMGASNHSFNAPLEQPGLDFLLEGIPTIVAAASKANNPRGPHTAPDSVETIDIKELKRNTAIAAVTAFGVAERAEPIGPRQFRSEIESLLKSSGLEEQMKIAGLWSLWESGQRGRLY